MTDIQTDNPEIEKSLRRIIKTAEEAGASFADDMTISCLDNYMTVFAPAHLHGENSMMRVPSAALPPVDFFKVALKGDDLYVASYDKNQDLAASQIKLMELMLELYNITGKIKDYRQTSPWLFFHKHHELRDHILKGRDAKTVSDLLSCEDYSSDKEIIETYFKSRKLGFRSRPEAPPSPVLMPILDCLNHHLQSPSYISINEPEQTGLAVKASVPVPGSDECFVRYGPYDALDTLVNYGFAATDDIPVFTRSVVTEIDFVDYGAGKLVIHGHTVSNMPRQSPPELADIPFFQPTIVMHSPDRLEVSHILIPGPRNPRALHRVLAFLIRGGVKPQATNQELLDMISLAEQTIINNNKDYYKTLAMIADRFSADEQNSPMVKAIRETIDIQTAKIARYEEIKPAIL